MGPGWKGGDDVTGGGAADDGIGNGRAAAILLARAGANVLVVDRDLTLADRTAEMTAAEGGNAVAASLHDVDQFRGRRVQWLPLNRRPRFRP